MATPTVNDIKNKNKFKQSLVKTLAGADALDAFEQSTGQMLKVMSTIRLSEKKMCSMLRSNIRQTWMMSPLRLLKLETTRIADMDDNTRTKWLWECECCRGKFKGTDVQTDHISGEHQFKQLSDLESYAKSILDVTLDDLQILCKECHEVKTYAERYGLTIDESKVEKVVIAWMKQTSVSEQKEYLTLHGKPCNNAQTRKDSYRECVVNTGL